ncbi:Uncharacterised protein r2_g1227 [Pycnogonum litorale]
MAKIPEFQWDVSEVAEEFKIFKQRMELHFEDQGIEDEAKQAIKIKIYVGSEGLRRLNASGLTNSDMKVPAKIWDIFDQQLKIKVNFRIHRLEFLQYRQNKEETLDDFVTRCRTKGRECDFSTEELQERILKLVMVSTSCEPFQRELLDTPKGYSTQEMLDLGRKYEAIAMGRQTLQAMEPVAATIGAVIKQKCKCGLTHQPKKCPAYNDKCNYCHGTGHWEKCCKKTDSEGNMRKPRKHFEGKNGRRENRWKHTASRQSGREEVNAINVEDEIYTFSQITSSARTTRDKTFTMLDIILQNKPGCHKLKLKVDTGAQRNTLPLRILRKMFPERMDSNGTPRTTKSNVRLLAYNGTEIEHYGTISIPCRFKDSGFKTVTFCVVDVNGAAIAGLPTCGQLNIVTLNCAIMHEEGSKPAHINSREELKRLYP